MMNTVLILSSLVLVIIAAIVTVKALKQEERKMNEYKTNEYSYEDALKRSQHYEENSVSTMLPVQIWSYVIVTVVTLVLVGMFAIYY